MLKPKQVWIQSCLLVMLALFSVGVNADQTKVKPNTHSAKLHALFELEWQQRIQRDPSEGLRYGIIERSDKLLDVSEQAYAKWEKKLNGYLTELETIPFNRLSESDQVNYQIFKQQLQRSLDEIRFKTYQMPFLVDSGFHTDVLRLAEEQQFKVAADYESYIKRLKAVPNFIEQNITNMKAGLERNYAMPKVVMAGFSDVIKSSYISGVENSPFWKPFNQMPPTLTEKQKKSLADSAKRVIESEVFKSLKTLYRFFENEYIPHTKTSLGAYDFDNGEAYYAAQIKHYTTLDLTAEEIHQIGLNEVKRIRAEMDQILVKLEFPGSFKEFVTFLRESPQFYAKSGEELIKEAAYIAKRMDAQLPKLFKHLPRQPYAVEPVPESIAPKYTTGRYVPAPLNSERPGTYWVNTYALDKRPLYVLEALTLHEAVPGHHLQVALSKELDSLPNFRRYSYISAFGEGWGLYSEKLGLEVGFYQDHYSNFGRLTYEMWRAARLVIDTGIHAKGWTREQAIALLENNSALSTHNIRTEVDRYISWPGQALAYKLGELKILELRAYAEKRLKDKFNIRDFHHEVLRQGPVPLNVLEAQIKRYVKSTLAE
ncbi:DUF885 domain-containing protein [Aliikangiella sp. IMCC44653]